MVRDRLGEVEDEFFATIFVGSGLLFLAMLFAAAAVTGGFIISSKLVPAQMINSATFHFARVVAYNMMNVYAIKASCVFMFTTSTIAIYTGFAPRWIAILGLCIIIVASIRESLPELELCRFSNMGTCDEHFHSL